jgi:hypothetical protein
MYQKERRYLPSDLRPAFGSTCGETPSDGDLEILVSNPIGVFGTHRVRMTFSAPTGFDVDG